MFPRLLLLPLLCVSAVIALQICSFNVRSFGGAKVSRPEILQVILQTISRCDIMLLMEIKDSSNKAFPYLMDQLNSKSKRNVYRAVISERLGRKTYKEQYAFIYRQKAVSLKDIYQYQDLQPGDEDAFSREPFVVWFNSPTAAVKEFVVIPQHTTPETAVREIDELYDVYLHMKQRWNSENYIFMGDFNAACGYVPKKSWKDIRLRSNPSFVWLIGDKNDTTVKQTTNCAYDRIVIHGEEIIKAVDPKSVNIFDFKTANGLTEEQALNISDHFPVEFKLKAAPRKTRLRSQSNSIASLQST
ncbi:deoxyribonuclease gamma [Protopterus annectens]|uniref:deoxyribonuclease gamma n=1 Tax=Protopterus annectens TaxID=7888 RepID=UPI001CFBD898|nr:deoxyribonuclease gamma [Protopterus annectens]